MPILSTITRIRFLLGVFFCIAIQTAAAQTDASSTHILPEGLDWKYNPANGHYYALFESTTWYGAQSIAISFGGYLATINSEEENNWILENVTNNSVKFFIGLTFSYELNRWVWENNENLQYTNWRPGEPNNYDLNEYCTVVYEDGGWNDIKKDHIYNSVIELESPISFPEGYQWKYNPNNGHYYAYSSESFSWHDSNKEADNLGGYLVAINDEQELEWIHESFYPFYWTGLIFENNAWIWINGDPVTYTNWISGEPSGDGDFAEETGYGWNDRPDNLEHPCLIEFDHFPTFDQPTLKNWSSLNGDTIEENQLIAGAPKGYEQGIIKINDIPTGVGSDGKGLEIKLMPGQGAFITSLQQFSFPSYVHLSGYVKASNQEAEIALIGLNSPIDGQVAYTNVRADEVPIDDYKQFHLIFAPPSGNFQYAIQAVNSPFSSLSTTIWIDNIEVEAFEPQEEAVFLPLAENGNFEGGLQNIISNINGDDGIVLPIFESMTDIAIRMSLKPANTAANIGTFCVRLEDQFPLRVLGQVNIKRESLPGGGMAAIVLTNGFQNLGVFRKADEINDVNDGEDHLMIGGDFSVDNPNIPVSVFVQIGGPGAEVSVIVDDLILFKN
ncbi:MAG: hypothetical protein JXR73_16160 [Candidatus Omnitrophica bacterium]|nr:hypothetical protein [Candidatus Omnitrophota bacterium]